MSETRIKSSDLIDILTNINNTLIQMSSQFSSIVTELKNIKTPVHTDTGFSQPPQPLPETMIQLPPVASPVLSPPNPDNSKFMLLKGDRMGPYDPENPPTRNEHGLPLSGLEPATVDSLGEEFNAEEKQAISEMTNLMQAQQRTS